DNADRLEESDGEIVVGVRFGHADVAVASRDSIAQFLIDLARGFALAVDGNGQARFLKSPGRHLFLASRSLRRLLSEELFQVLPAFVGHEISLARCVTFPVRRVEEHHPAKPWNILSVLVLVEADVPNLLTDQKSPARFPGERLAVRRSVELLKDRDLVSWLRFANDVHLLTLSGKVIFSVMDFPIRPHIGVRPVLVLHVPMKVFLSATGVSMRSPLISKRVHVSVAVAPWRVLQPIPPFRRHKRMAPAPRQPPPRGFYRPIPPPAHAAAPCTLLTRQARLLPPRPPP